MGKRTIIPLIVIFLLLSVSLFFVLNLNKATKPEEMYAFVPTDAAIIVQPGKTNKLVEHPVYNAIKQSSVLSRLECYQRWLDTLGVYNKSFSDIIKSSNKLISIHMVSQDHLGILVFLQSGQMHSDKKMVKLLNAIDYKKNIKVISKPYEGEKNTYGK
ncbi:MAG: hypothetical protein HC896_12635 [Bacteroidales bacterium]|nr:hypothetical protein [Bacteroidales bacterium]